MASDRFGPDHMGSSTRTQKRIRKKNLFLTQCYQTNFLSYENQENKFHATLFHMEFSALKNKGRKQDANSTPIASGLDLGGAEVLGVNHRVKNKHTVFHDFPPG